jgi:hypothetical protein
LKNYASVPPASAPIEEHRRRLVQGWAHSLADPAK